jgi:DNA polymerase I-like protein with 3'-5' exonuclease and polymerase domains
METPSAAQLIKRYVELRESIDVICKRHAEELAPYKHGLETLEGLLADEINRLEGQNIKTEYGTAYRSTVTRFKVASDVDWFNWVFKNDRCDMLTRNVSGEAIKEYMDTNGGQPPPGLNVSQIYRINIRSN